MADKTEFLQAIDDAILDADSLERFINGDDTQDVLTRLSKRYPTIKKALKELFESGGLPATPFETKALMEASSLVDGDYAVVTEDGDNNGLYIKSNGSWSNSEYDIVNLSKQYTNQYTDSYSGALLNVFLDGNGDVYEYTTSGGKKYLSGLEGSLQDNINKNKASFETDGGSSILTVKDKDGVVALDLSKNGDLYVNKIRATNIIKPLDDLALQDRLEQDKKSIRSAYLKDLDSALATEPTAEDIEYVLIDAADFEGVMGAFAPAITQIAPNKFYFAVELRRTGHDYNDMRVVGRTITYDPDTKGLTFGDVQTLAENGIDGNGIKYTFINAKVTYVEKGANAGRIYIHCTRMTNPVNAEDRVYVPHMMYSDNGGEAFTQPVDFTDQIPNFAEGHNLLTFSPGHGLQLANGECAGRLVLSCYSRHPDSEPDSREWAAITLLSDDGGNSWFKGEYINLKLLNEWDIAELEDGSIVGICRYDSGYTEKYRVISTDGGVTFSEPELVPEINGAGTKTGLTSTVSPFLNTVPKLIAVNALGSYKGAYQREDAHFWVSYDKGESWSEPVQLDTGVCQYTEATMLDREHALIMWGGGDFSLGDKIKAKILNTKYLMKGVSHDFNS